MEHRRFVYSERTMTMRAGTNSIGPWTLLAFLSLVFVLNYVDRQIVFAIFPLLRHDLGFTDTQLGLAGSVFTWTYSLSMPFTGRLADVVPRHRMVIAALALWSAVTAATAMSHTVNQFLFWRFLMGLSEALYVPAGIGLITEAHPGTTRSRALAIHGFAQFTGITLGGWYGGWSAEHIGWRTGFLILGGVGVCYSCIVAARFRGFESTIVRKPSPGSSPLDIARSRCYLTLCVAFLTFCSMLWMLYAWLPNYVYETFHLSLSGSGLTATLYLQISSACGSLLGGWTGDRVSRVVPTGRFRIVVAGLLTCAPFAFGIYHSTSLIALKLCACGFGLCAGFFIANAFASAYDVIEPRNFGLATGLMNMLGGWGGGAAILLTGVFKKSLGTGGLMLYASGTAMILAVVLLIVVEKRYVREHQYAREGTGVPELQSARG